MRTGVRPPVSFEVDVSRKGGKGKAEKSGGGGLFGGAGKSRAVEARFLGKREAEWKKMREKKNLKIQEARENRKKMDGVKRGKTLIERARVEERKARKITGRVGAKEGKEFNEIVGGRVNDTIKSKAGGGKGEKGKGENKGRGLFGGKKGEKKGGKAGAEEGGGEEEKKESSPSGGGGGGGHFRDSMIGVMPLERVSLVEKGDVSKDVKEATRSELR